ncbi:hypothetical protein EON65_01460 [archaeon]|nr:MAG: hypothetical protein EON65_01460 [archaeon]
MRIIKDVHTRIQQSPVPPGHVAGGAGKQSAAPSNVPKTLTQPVDTKARRSWC